MYRKIKNYSQIEPLRKLCVRLEDEKKRKQKTNERRGEEKYASINLDSISRLRSTQLLRRVNLDDETK
ncbi:Protein CBG27883 [Caenorhabditis briggsae]|uniref:Protein CBG27883 n=1 Tax=Caenorhabditis briggsae TaxID=6238 RepID=B6IEH8_CAEBR|nr:Protein CBG27883 [Caenorhabditis briggsae]CAR98308.1 Protein CBG27883 [Caenorhabditis briggsae]